MDLLFGYGDILPHLIIVLRVIELNYVRSSRIVDSTDSVRNIKICNIKFNATCFLPTSDSVCVYKRGIRRESSRR